MIEDQENTALPEAELSEGAFETESFLSTEPMALADAADLDIGADSVADSVADSGADSVAGTASEKESDPVTPEDQAGEHVEAESSDFETAFKDHIRVQRRETEEQLRKEWGRDFIRNTAMAVQVVNRFLSPEEQQVLRQNGVEASAEFRQLCARMGQFLGEDPAASGAIGLGMQTGNHDNPYASGQLNLSKQVALERSNPSLAQSLKRAAGKSFDDAY